MNHCPLCNRLAILAYKSGPRVLWVDCPYCHKVRITEGVATWLVGAGRETLENLSRLAESSKKDEFLCIEENKQTRQTDDRHGILATIKEG